MEEYCKVTNVFPKSIKIKNLKLKEKLKFTSSNKLGKYIILC